MKPTSGRAIVTSLACAAGLLAGAGTAAASYPSAANTSFVGPTGPGTSVVAGVVASPEPKCIANRTIRVTLTTPGGDIPLDIARSGQRGGWQARGTNAEFTGITAVKINLAKRKVGKGKKAIKCRGEKEALK